MTTSQEAKTRPIPQSVLEALAADERAEALARELKAEMDAQRPSYAISLEDDTRPLGQEEEQDS